jgi:hypothetical protein
LNVSLTICKPGGNDAAEVPRAVVNGREDGSVLGMNKFCDQQWSRTMGNGNTESNQETGCNKHLDVDAN